MVSITNKPIDPAFVLKQVSTPESGGIDLFIGTVRNHSDGKRVQKLEYTAYAPMAERIMAQIEREIKEKWEVNCVVLVHRVGGLNIGDIAVVTAVSAAHRHEAFEACRFAIDRIKSVVPIWKKEYFEGEVKWSAGGEG
jgi:molybdopterin synthase catalytic subunit